MAKFTGVNLSISYGGVVVSPANELKGLTISPDLLHVDAEPSFSATRLRVARSNLSPPSQSGYVHLPSDGSELLLDYP